jgi:hypothetical protein
MRSKLAVIGLSVFAVFAIACGAASNGPTQGPGVDNDGGDQSESTSGHTIQFEVTGDGVASANSISYGIGGNISQANGAALPWSQEATSEESFLILSLTAQSSSDSGGSISCKITVDGEMVVENRSEGAFAVVTCSGTR